MQCNNVPLSRTSPFCFHHLWYDLEFSYLFLAAIIIRQLRGDSQSDLAFDITPLATYIETQVCFVFDYAYEKV